MICQLIPLLNNEFNVLLLRSLRQRVHTMLEKFENAAFSLRSRLPSTVIGHENGASFRKRSSNRRNLKTPAFRFRADGKILKTEFFDTIIR